MSLDDSNHAKGLLLTAIGGLALTVDIPLIKLADGDVWSILLVRTGMTLAATFLIWSAWRAICGRAPALIPGRYGLAVAFFYGLTSLCFISAVFHTSTANLVFIVAFSTVFASILSWLFLNERPRNATLLAMAAMIVGIAIIVSDGIEAGRLFGDFLALMAAFFLACAITVSRRSGKEMGFTSLIAVVLPFAVALVMVLPNGLSIEAPWWIVLNGAIVMPISFFCLATGPRYLSGPEVAMFYLLETVLAPIWVWIIFSETPTTRTLIGGTILVAALLAHSCWQLYQGRRRRLVAMRAPA